MPTICPMARIEKTGAKLLGVRIPAELHRQLKIMLARTDVSIAKLVEKAIWDLQALTGGQQQNTTKNRGEVGPGRPGARYRFR